MSQDLVLAQAPLGPLWQTTDPFLFCAHHDDLYPPGNSALGPAESLSGRDIGSDFAGKDGWRMYHGDVVPGFPQHPHRGFETVTIVRHGRIDHSDSLGATARFGSGDVQWLTAGSGIVHSEMFPLLRNDERNRLELFQIWLNLPRRSKMVKPYFSMFWSEQIPSLRQADARGKATDITLIAGSLGGVSALPPPPESWASDPGSDVAIWTLRIEPGASFLLPAVKAGVVRVLYLFQGGPIDVGGTEVLPSKLFVPAEEVPIPLRNGDQVAELLVLAGRPIGEPVAQHGPFVMNTREELEQTYKDFQRTRFGGWPWPSDGPVHDAKKGRFALYPDGKLEERT